jgi:predicted Zn finger-like uncharacterized protein
MILTCQECQTRYLVADASMHMPGRLVRCASCGHSWFARWPEEIPALPADIAQAETASSEETPTPALAPALAPTLAIETPPAETLPNQKPPRRASGRASIISLALALLVLLLTPFAFRGALLQNHPGLESIFRMVGVYRVGELRMTDLRIEKEVLAQNMLHVTIRCALFNAGQESHLLPDLRVTILSASGKPIGHSPPLLDTGSPLAEHADAACRAYSFTMHGNAGLRARLDLSDPFSRFIRQCRERLAL